MTFDDLMGKNYTGGDKLLTKLYRSNQDYFNRIVTGIRENRVIPMFGAGFTHKAYGSWKDLFLGMAEGYDSETEVTACLDRGEFEEAAQALEDDLSRHSFLEEMEQKFGLHTLEEAMTKISPERRLLPEIFKSTLLTTNVDRVIETIYGNLDHICPHTNYQTLQTNAVNQSGKQVLMKLHGDIEDPANMVFTKTDYDRFYPTVSGEQTPLYDYLRRVFQSKTILFLGCSLDTDRVVKVLEQCNAGCTYFTLMSLPDATKNPDDCRIPILRGSNNREIPAFKEKRQALSGKHINCIWYPAKQYKALDVFLEELHKRLNPSASTKSSPIPPPPQYALVGRDDLIDNVYQTCSLAAGPIFVTGTGGIGKTEVCRAVLRKLEQDGKRIIYADVTGALAVTDFCDRTADAAGIQKLRQEQIGSLQNYLEYLQDNFPAGVLYLGNWEDVWNKAQTEEQLAILQWMQALIVNGILILVSSRVFPTRFAITPKQFNVCPLDDEQTRKLFLDVYRKKGGNLFFDCESLIRQLDGHPLAIVLAATFAARQPSWELVLQGWTEASQVSPHAPHESLKTALRATWNTLDNPCRQLWGLLALTQEALPLTWLKEMTGTDFKAAVSRLWDASLITWSADGTMLQMLIPIKETFFQLAEELVIRKAFGYWVDYITGISEIANIDGHKNQNREHLRLLERLPQAIHIQERMLNIKNLDFGEDLTTLLNELRNYYQFTATVSLPVLIKLVDYAKKKHMLRLFAYGNEKCGDLYCRSNQLENALDAYSQAEERYREVKDDLGLANVLRGRGDVYLRQNQSDEALDCYTQVEERYREMKHDLGLANALYGRGDVYLCQDQLDEALDCYTKAEERYREMNRDLGLANALRRRGDVYLCQDQLDKALDCFTKAEELSRKVKSDVGLANALLGRGDVYLRQDQLDKALDCYTKAEERSRKMKDDLGLANVAFRRGELYRHQGDLKQAADFYDKADSLYQKIQENWGMAAIPRERALLYAQAGRYEDAITCLEKALQWFETAKRPLEIAETYVALALVYRMSPETAQQAQEAEQKARAVPLEPALQAHISKLLEDTTLTFQTIHFF